MPNGQVSVWVPIIVGVLGLVGVIAGQLVNAWREDRRWKREQEREELRWRRETERENARLRAENAGQWRDHKIKLYGELVRAVREVDHLNTSILTHVNLHESGVDDLLIMQPIVGLEKQLDQKLEHLITISTEVELVSSKELRFVLQERFYDLISPVGKLRHPAYANREWHEGEIDEYFGNHIRKVSEIREQIESLVRQELGVETPNLSS